MASGDVTRVSPGSRTTRPGARPGWVGRNNVTFVRLERLTPEVPNLDAAFVAASAAGCRPAAVAAALGYHVLLSFTGLGRTAPLQALADACRHVSDLRGQAICIQRLGDIALARSDPDVAREAYEQARPL